jgi:carbonic anhydrase/acetyltransferase-like protein (isoleucine patch superfamily)
MDPRPHDRFGPLVRVDPAAWVHASAQLYGAVEVAAEASIWPNVVVRAEQQAVRIGARSNIQDFVMIHIAAGPTLIGEDCSITHHCTLHGCRIGDRVLVGMGATVTDDCEIGDNSIVAGGSFLKEGTIVPPNSIVMGTPGKVVRERNNAAANALNAWMYARNAEAYARGEHRLWSQPEFLAAQKVERERLVALHAQ